MSGKERPFSLRSLLPRRRRRPKARQSPSTAKFKKPNNKVDERYWVWKGLSKILERKPITGEANRKKILQEQLARSLPLNVEW